MSPPPSYQTIRLTRGQHRSPGSGACVMELASMLAGEAFTDHPRSVCPIIGTFLRTYNDAIDDHRRQDLYWLAARVVGTRGGRGVRVERARHCHRRLRCCDGRWAGPRWPGHVPARRLALVLAETGEHATALALVAELIELGQARQPEPLLRLLADEVKQLERAR